MPGRAAKVIVTEKQQAILQTFANSRSVSVSLSQRSKIILLAFEGHQNDVIEPIVGLQHDAVGAWRRRWRDHWAKLIDIECSEERHVLEHAIVELLSDRKRSGRPRRMTAEEDAAIFKTACEDPQKKTDPLRGGAVRSCAFA